MNQPPISLVYVIRDDTDSSAWELKFSLRSVAKNLSGIANACIVTNALPPFVNPETVSLIQETDGERLKDANICRKILAACNDGRVTDDFLFINDDHFILKPVDAREIPPYNKGRLMEKYNLWTSYSRLLEKTHKFLRAASLDITHFDIHTPIIYNKAKFQQMAQFFKWKQGVVIKSLYGNFHQLDSSHLMEDLKIKQPLALDRINALTTGRTFLSTDANAKSSGMIQFLTERFGSTPCRFEKQQ